MVFARVADCNSDRAAVPVENAKGLIDPLNCKETKRKLQKAKKEFVANYKLHKMYVYYVCTVVKNY